MPEKPYEPQPQWQLMPNTFPHREHGERTQDEDVETALTYIRSRMPKPDRTVGVNGSRYVEDDD